MKKMDKNSHSSGGLWQKQVRVMKLCFILTFIGIMHLSAATYSQDTRLDLKVKNASLESVMNNIRTQSEYSFFFDDVAVKKISNITLDLKGASIEEVLTTCLKNTGFSFRVLDKTIILFREKAKDEKKKSYLIEGKVLDENNRPMPGVTVLLDSTKVGTATDTAGHFVLPLPQPKGILVFSFIGYKTQKVKYTDGKLVIVKMQPDVSGLDEVQVIAYGSQKKRTVISAISTLKADEMKELPTHSLESLLQGHMAGVEVNNLSGAPGGGGSIGSELCRQIAAHHPSQLVIFDIYENTTYDLQQELKKKFPNLNLVVLIGSVRNTHRVDTVFSDYKPAIVFHAAAHKHVPLMEDSPNEAIKNNVFGTYNVAMAAGRNGTERMVLISTDKAVNPTNIMGASKRICEMIIQGMQHRFPKTNYVAVRFGNVLGSNGSVIPLFKKQIAEGGPVTVTDKNIIRYFMTIPEAVSLVLQAGAYARGGEIFVLDMGEPVKILDLATNLIKLSGYRVGEDIQIVFTGLRPGEKMYEELLMNEEGLKETANKMIFIGKPIEFDEEVFRSQLVELEREAMDETSDIRAAVEKIVTTYHPAEE